MIIWGTIHSGHLPFKISYWKYWTIVNSREHSLQNFSQQMLWRLSAIAKKCPSSQIELKLNSFSYSKAGHCKNLSDLTHKICSKILQKVRQTSMTNIFLKSSEGQLFPERLKDIFLVAYLFMFSGISIAATNFAITVKKNITGNNYMFWSYLAEKILFKLVSKSLEIFCKFQAWPNLFIKPDRACKKREYKTKVYVQ